MGIVYVIAYICIAAFVWFVVVPWHHKFINKSDSKGFDSTCHMCGKPSRNGAHYECFGPTVKNPSKSNP